MPDIADMLLLAGAVCLNAGIYLLFGLAYALVSTGVTLMGLALILELMRANNAAA